MTHDLSWMGVPPMEKAAIFGAAWGNAARVAGSAGQQAASVLTGSGQQPAPKTQGWLGAITNWYGGLSPQNKRYLWAGLGSAGLGGLMSRLSGRGWLPGMLGGLGVGIGGTALYNRYGADIHNWGVQNRGNKNKAPETPVPETPAPVETTAPIANHGLGRTHRNQIHGIQPAPATAPRRQRADATPAALAMRNAPAPAAKPRRLTEQEKPDYLARANKYLLTGRTGREGYRLPAALQARADMYPRVPKVFDPREEPEVQRAPSPFWGTF